jgi:hypothetical protein
VCSRRLPSAGSRAALYSIASTQSDPPWRRRAAAPTDGLARWFRGPARNHPECPPNSARLIGSKEREPVTLRLVRCLTESSVESSVRLRLLHRPALPPKGGRARHKPSSLPFAERVDWRPPEGARAGDRPCGNGERELLR